MSDEKTGEARLSDALTTKGTAFTRAERRKFGLVGLLPTAEKTLEQQAEHCWHEFSTRRDDLDKHIYLRALQDRNETLFYRVLRDHIPETMPIVYTPTVGEACQRFSEIYRRPRGLFVSYPDRDLLGEMLRNRSQRDVDVIVVTDGQRILGLGDQGIGGMGIPIGKLSLYTLIGGIDPARTLPIVLDVGTDNVELLDDPQYLGWRHRRITDDDYDAFIDGFVATVQQELPDVLLQWEDFANAHALPILQRCGFSAVINVVTRRVNGVSEWDAAGGLTPRPLMSADQILEWQARGFEFGSHSRTHPDLTTLSDDEKVAILGGNAAKLLGL